MQTPTQSSSNQVIPIWSALFSLASIVGGVFLFMLAFILMFKTALG
jgi:hypothetical protein